MREWVVTLFGLWLLNAVVGVLLTLPFTGWPDPAIVGMIGLTAMIAAIALYRSGHSATTYWRWLRRPPRDGI